jgi:transposase
MLCDFYGNVLVAPTVVAHTGNDFAAALAQLQEAVRTHELKDLLVAVERTGRYHHLPKQAFANAGYEVRIVHPFATKQFRQPSDPGNKTDDTDLAAIHRATVSGFALREAERDEMWTTLQLLERHRRDIVFKTSALCAQIREHLEAALPGYAACFENLWDSPVAWPIVAVFDSPQAIRQAGSSGLADCLRQSHVRFQHRTLEAILAWANAAASPELAAPIRRRIALDLNQDRLCKTAEIQGLERELAAFLVRTPYVLLLSWPGINVVSAAELAGEMGPIQHYASGRCITGRAGLRPARYQSDQVDITNGPLVRCANRRLRAALMMIADNLIVCNQHFRALATSWRLAGKDPRHSRVKIAGRFGRIVYQMVAGGQVCRHPSVQQRDYVITKLLAFHAEHQTPMPQTLADVQATIDHLPKREYRTEALPLAEELKKIQEGRRRGPQPIGDILPLVLARLGLQMVQSQASGEGDSR